MNIIVILTVVLGFQYIINNTVYFLKKRLSIEG